jgi:hypothetical protein
MIRWLAAELDQLTWLKRNRLRVLTAGNAELQRLLKVVILSAVFRKLNAVRCASTTTLCQDLELIIHPFNAPGAEHMSRISPSSRWNPFRKGREEVACFERVGGVTVLTHSIETRQRNKTISERIDGTRVVPKSNPI